MAINLRGRTGKSEALKRFKAIERGGSLAKVPVTIRVLMQRCNRKGTLSLEKVYRRDMNVFLHGDVALSLSEFEQKARDLGMLRPWESLATE